MKALKTITKIIFAVGSFVLTVFCMSDAVKEKNRLEAALDRDDARED